MIALMTYVLQLFILRLRLQPTAEGQSLSMTTVEGENCAYGSTLFLYNFGTKVPKINLSAAVTVANERSLVERPAAKQRPNGG